jgi:hypothetical protein
LGYNNLAKLVNNDMVKGINVDAADFTYGNKEVCDPFVIAKHPRAPFPTSEAESSRQLELLHMDLCGPMKVVSLEGNRYIATFLDDYSKLSVVRPLEYKSDVISITRRRSSCWRRACPACAWSARR